MEDTVLFRWSKFVSDEEVEALENRLIGAGIIYSVERLARRKSLRVSSYSPEKKEMDDLQSSFGGGVTRILPDDWQPGADDEPGRVIRIRDQLIVMESADEAVWRHLQEENPEKIVLSFPPQLAFGTGGHPTTANCLRLLVDHIKTLPKSAPWSLLDLGCGTGIFAIAAAKLGGENIVAIELDSLAVNCARENAERHGVADQITFIEGDAIAYVKQAPEQFTVVAANLFSDLLLESMPHFPAVMKQTDHALILSGFLTTQAKEVVESSRKHGVGLKTFLRRGNWVAAGRIA